MTKQEHIEELQKILPNIEVVKAMYRDVDFAEFLYDEGVRKINKNAVVLTEIEYEMLANQYKALDIKYTNLSDNYRLCKNANETLKHNVVTARKETAKKILTAMRTMIINRRADERSGLNCIYSEYKPERLLDDISDYVKVVLGVEVRE